MTTKRKLALCFDGDMDAEKYFWILKLKTNNQILY